MDVIELIKRHEGFEPCVYCDACGAPLRKAAGQNLWVCTLNGCQGGNLTLGYGARVDGAGLSEPEASALLRLRTEVNRAALLGVAAFAQLDEVRQAAILDMAHCMGVAGVFGFKLMWRALKSADYQAAADEVLNSEWANQERTRAAGDAALLRTGQWR